MIRKSMIFCAIIMPLSALVGQIQASPVQWESVAGGNDHWYRAVLSLEALSWTEAKIAAEAAGGYLATSTSIEENEFIFELIDSPEFWIPGTSSAQLGPWLGGYQTDDTSGAASNWHWVTGELWSFTNWNAGEPNNALGIENYLHFFDYGTRDDTWNDLRESPLIPINAYIIEYDSLTPVPLPASIWLLGTSIGLFSWVGKRNRHNFICVIKNTNPCIG